MCVYEWDRSKGKGKHLYTVTDMKRLLHFWLRNRNVSAQNNIGWQVAVSVNHLCLTRQLSKLLVGVHAHPVFVCSAFIQTTWILMQFSITTLRQVNNVSFQPNVPFCKKEKEKKKRKTFFEMKTKTVFMTPHYLCYCSLFYASAERVQIFFLCLSLVVYNYTQSKPSL